MGYIGMTIGAQRSTVADMRLGWYLATVLTVLVVAPGPAHAGWRIDRAKAIAAIVWHNPCGGNVKVTFGVVVDGAEAEADVADCLVTFNIHGDDGIHGRWPWPVLCKDMLHEYGHLAGYRDPANTADPDHSTNRSSVMFAPPPDAPALDGLTYWTDPRCDFRGRRYLEAHDVP
jgi:hypothetical protein